MLGVLMVYLGLAATLAGGASLLRPLRFLAIRTRRQAAWVLAAGLGLILIGVLLPARETRISPPRTHLDQFVPAYQFSEFHSVRVKASREQAYQAIKLVAADDVLLFRTLTWLRRFGRPGPESILNSPPGKPLLEVAVRTSFLLLAEEPDREIVVGTLVMAPRGWRPAAEPSIAGFQQLFHEPGFVVAAMNFRLEDAGAGITLITTETRIYATDDASRRRFARYWRVIYPGSALIRRMWLRAIARRAQTAPSLVQP
jgi:hypothetical protein